MGHNLGYTIPLYQIPLYQLPHPPTHFKIGYFGVSVASRGQFHSFATLILSLMMQGTFLQSDLRQILGWHPPKEKRIMERATDDDKWWPDADGPQRRFRGYPMQLSAGVSQCLAGRNYALYEPAKAIHSRGGIRRRGRSNCLLIWH